MYEPYEVRIWVINCVIDFLLTNNNKIMITREELETIFEETKSDWSGDNAFQGLTIISKYIKDKDILCAAEHDIIYSVDLDDIIEAGITQDDAVALRKLNWMIEGEFDCLACFV